jgi:hypothetical protein
MFKHDGLLAQNGADAICRELTLLRGANRAT